MYTTLIVDDEYMIKLTLKKLIQASDLPFQIVGEAEDGREALDFIAQFKPDLVITDIRMPVMGGLELIEEAYKRDLNTRFIIISGHDDFSYAQKALRFNVVDYLLKPLKPLQLQETLEGVYKRLKAEEQTRSDRSEWIWYCKNKAPSLVKHIWLLNEAEVLEELKGIHSELVLKVQHEGLKEIYMDLMTLMEGEITQMTGLSNQLVLPQLSALPDQPDLLYQAVEAHIMQIIIEIRLARNWVSHQNIRRASEYMEAHFTQAALSMQEVAEITGMSSSYFSRSFKEEFGMNFIQYLTQLRMEKAKSLLSDPMCKTYEIAYAVGYSDYSHFTKVFKKYWGLSPTEFKKRI